MAALKTGVVVTAVASTTALAPDADDTWQRLLAGESGIRELAKPFITEFESPVRIGGELREDVDQYLTRVELRRLSFMQKLSTVLGRRLWDSAGSPDVDTRRLLVSIAHGWVSTEPLILLYDEFRAKKMRGTSPLAVQMHMPNAPAAAVGLDRGAKAGVITPEMADASGAAAVAHAWRSIVFGDADIAICGGVESAIETVPVAALAGLGLLSTDNDNPSGACRPFDRDRNGTVLSEGGALLLLETEEHAKARGAQILGRLLGSAIRSDSYDPIEPDPSGEEDSHTIVRAIELADLRPSDIDVFNANASGTRSGDLAEAHAIRRAFGGHAPAVYAPKAALGHSWGAAGAVEAVLTVQSLRDGAIPPTLNLTNLDPEIDLDVVAGEVRRGHYRYAVSNSSAMGGHHVALVFGAV